MKISRLFKGFARSVVKISSALLLISLIGAQIHTIIRISQGTNAYTDYVTNHVEFSLLLTFIVYFLLYGLLKDENTSREIILKYITFTIPSIFLTVTYFLSGAFVGTLFFNMFILSVFGIMLSIILVLFANFIKNKAIRQVKHSEVSYY